MSHIVYKVTSKTSDKSYIGRSKKSIEERFKEHVFHSFNDKCNKTHFHNAIKKYGKDDFILEILEPNLNEVESRDREIYWINFYDTFKGDGYNMTIGGDGFGSGENHPMFGSKRFGELNPFYGKTHTDETKSKLSEKTENMVIAKDITSGNIIKITKDEFQNDENLVGVTSGYSVSQETKDKISRGMKKRKQPTSICEYCQTEMTNANIGRHRVKCKEKNEHKSSK